MHQHNQGYHPRARMSEEEKQGLAAQIREGIALMRAGQVAGAADVLAPVCNRARGYGRDELTEIIRDVIGRLFVSAGREYLVAQQFTKARLCLRQAYRLCDCLGIAENDPVHIDCAEAEYRTGHAADALRLIQRLPPAEKTVRGACIELMAQLYMGGSIGVPKIDDLTKMLQPEMGNPWYGELLALAGEVLFFTGAALERETGRAFMTWLRIAGMVCGDRHTETRAQLLEAVQSLGEEGPVVAMGMLLGQDKALREPHLRLHRARNLLWQAHLQRAHLGNKTAARKIAARARGLMRRHGFWVWIAPETVPARAGDTGVVPATAP